MTLRRIHRSAGDDYTADPDEKANDGPVGVEVIHLMNIARLTGNPTD
jgi:hypothetical protein